MFGSSSIRSERLWSRWLLDRGQCLPESGGRRGLERWPRDESVKFFVDAHKDGFRGVECCARFSIVAMLRYALLISCFGLEKHETRLICGGEAGEQTLKTSLLTWC